MRKTSSKHHCIKKKFSIKDFFSIFGKIYRKMRVWSHLLRKFSMENYCSKLTINTLLLNFNIAHLQCYLGVLVVDRKIHFRRVVFSCYFSKRSQDKIKNIILCKFKRVKAQYIMFQSHLCVY